METYLRMAGLKYEVDESMKFSSRGKLPWIEYEGREIEDSQLAISFLEGRLQRQMDSHLGAMEQALYTAFQRTLEDHLYFAGMQVIWIQKFSTFVRHCYSRPFLLGSLFALFLRRQISSSLYAHGMGRYRNEEVIKMAEDDIQALSVLLGDKRYMLGEAPSTFDACAFANLAGILALPFETPLKEFITKRSNLMDYVESMKSKYWSDWDKIISAQPRPSFLKEKREKVE